MEITVNNLGTVYRKNTEFLFYKKNGNGVPVHSHWTRTLQMAAKPGFSFIMFGFT